MSYFSFEDIKNFREKIGTALSDTEINKCIESTINELSGRLLRDVVRNTPVRKENGGKLKRGWKTTKIKKVGNVISRDVYNEVSYGLYVEKGHRTRKRKDGSRGWVEGKFMLEKSKLYLERVSPKVIEDKIYKLLRGGFK